MNSRLWKLAAVAVALCGLPALAQPASVDAANAVHQQAMASGSTADRILAAEALRDAVLADPVRPDAVLRAYEAGQTLCVYAACEGAERVANFAASGQLPADVLTGEDIALLSAFTDWSTGQAGARDRLDEALSASMSVRATPLSVVAFQSRYTSASNAQDWPRAARTAAEAAAYFAPHRQMIGERWSDAVLASATAGYNSNPNGHDARVLGQHIADLITLDKELKDRPDWLADQVYLSLAWQTAILMYFDTASSRRELGSGRYTVSGPDADQLKEQLLQLTASAGPSDLLPRRTGLLKRGALPLCEGDFDENPEVRYPANAARGRKYGSVVTRVDIEDGEVKDVEVLAAVPERTFDRNVISAVKKWTWEVTDGEPGVTCTIDYENMIYVIMFGIN